MRFHVVSLPHTETTKEYEWCAYTAKVRKFCNIMHDLDHKVYLYASENNEARCTEHIVCAENLPANGVIPTFSTSEPSFAAMASKTIGEMRKRVKPKDFVCVIGGLAQQTIVDAFPENLCVEFGVGYGGVCSNTFHVFESYAWMHTVYGAQTLGDSHAADGRFFDTVIPNYFEVEDFDLGYGTGEYLLYMGRLIDRKGLEIVLEVADRLDSHLVVAGTGDFALPANVDYRGVVNSQQRSTLMGSAQALIAPTLYLEPFGGVVVESHLCGTPTLTTDWGAFSETVQNGINGYRCHNISEFVVNFHRAKFLDRDSIRKNAMQYSTTRIAKRYENYFYRLNSLWDKGFYQ